MGIMMLKGKANTKWAIVEKELPDSFSRNSSTSECSISR